MYAKIPFNGGWSGAQIVSVLQALLQGTTNPASLPAGVTASATINNTIPHGWTVNSAAGGIVIANAPITGRTNKQKYVKLSSTSVAVDMVAGDSVNGSNVIQINGNNVTRIVQLWTSSQIQTSISMVLHVCITPSKFLTCIERVSSTNPITSANINHCVGGVCDVDFADAHYSDLGTLLPFATLDKVETTTASNFLVSVPMMVTNSRPRPTYTYYPKGWFVFAGIKNEIMRLPVDGILNRAGGPVTNHLFEVGVAPSENDPVTGKFIDLYAAPSAFAPVFNEHTINGKTHVAWSVGTANAGTPTTLLIPKE